MPYQCLILLLLFIISCNPALGSNKVLLLNSYHPQYAWTEELTRGVRDALAKDIAQENLFIEYMDKRRYVDDAIYNKKILDLLKYKFAHYRPDIIITSDDAAYRFLLEHGDRLFPNIPIVFCGVNIFNHNDLINKPNITGIAEGMDIAGNLNLIAQIQPNIKKIILIGDTTGLGHRMINAAKEIKNSWQKKSSKRNITIELLDDFSIAELHDTVSKLTDDTAILLMAIHKDKLGAYFSFQKDLPPLSARSSVPIYGMWGSLMINNGAIGGMMNNPYEHGSNAAKIALSILAGTDTRDVPVKESAIYRPTFDYVQLQRFHINENILPKNSKIYNKPESFYLKNRKLINSAIAIFLFLSLVIVILYNNILQRKNAQKKLHQFNLGLENTIKERTLELEKSNQELKKASILMSTFAHTDSLTSLSNRRSANQEIPAYIKRHSISQQNFVLGIVDIDHFKKINDNYGHQTGDQILIAIAQTLNNSLRPNDRVYRWGGEEFIIALPETAIHEASAICQRLSSNIAEISVHNISNITVSIGITSLQTHDSYDSIMHRADTALYQAKANGRNQIATG
ncbi:diguanylate cyclase [Dasania sp. GY-MA-18]|uniref:diguanylate cyclase n=1 Tax=Dasania phycosphaerae TaxID=2950436 RepID=A0A9J6RK27_9GAMM|nr:MULTISPECIES: ABC transporter substrate binding protein [Dasania]MCR8922616.1 diguanylate cyclase [Dasania sp. GY-MA-18]MCZ0865046.1 ABC transporter substrate binding protein [Dasania phycosphaerae]MCZ0868772.1 ABC transporter substrate binding protein [Dasania phycosphaerae]